MTEISSNLQQLWASVTRASSQAWAAVAVVIVIAALFFKIFFGDFAGFAECLRYFLRPNYASFLSQERPDDNWGSLRFFIWAALSFGCGLLAYYQLPGWFPTLFG